MADSMAGPSEPKKGRWLLKTVVNWLKRRMSFGQHFMNLLATFTMMKCRITFLVTRNCIYYVFFCTQPWIFFISDDDGSLVNLKRTDVANNQASNNAVSLADNIPFLRNDISNRICNFPFTKRNEHLVPLSGDKPIDYFRFLIEDDFPPDSGAN